MDERNKSQIIKCFQCSRYGNLLCKMCNISSWIEQPYKTNCLKCLGIMKYYTCQKCQRFYFYYCEDCKLYYCSDCIKQNTIDMGMMDLN